MLFHLVAKAAANRTYMDKEELITHVEQANKNAERSYWWLKNIKAEDVEELGMTNVLDKIRDVLSLLQQVDNITMDIMITIKQNTK